MPTRRSLGTHWWSLDVDNGRIGLPPVDVTLSDTAVNPPRRPIRPRLAANLGWPQVINPD